MLTELGVNVVALSVDNEETSAALIAKHKLRFPLGHNADAGKGAAVTGAPRRRRDRLHPVPDRDAA